MANLAVMTKTDARAVVETHLTECRGTLHLYILKIVKSTFVETLQAGSLKSIDGLQTTIACSVKKCWAS